jgi:hypothetical protein
VVSTAGTVEFDRFGPALSDGAEGTFNVTGGQYTVTLSGLDITGSTGCQQRGSKRFAIPPNSGGLTAFGTGPTRLEPYTYTLGVNALSPANTMDVTLHSCPPGAESYEGHVWSNYPVGGVSLNPPATYVSDDGITFSGSHTENQGPATLSQSWSLTGSP